MKSDSFIACVCECFAFRDRDAADVLAQAADRAHD